jgi:hypothetical protein
MKEKPPDDKWFCLDTAAIHEKLEHIEHRGTKILQRASPEDKELVKFQKAIPRIGVLPSKKTMTIAIVGKQGMGKSSLCNALLQRPDLAETSNRGKACTQYMTRYVFRPGNDDRRKVSDVSVKFLDKATIRELLSRLIGQYEFFHFVTQEPDTDYSEEEDLANSAEQVLRLVYNADIDDASEKTLNSLLTAHAIEKGELLHSSIGMAMQRIEEAGADDDGIKSMYELNDRQVREKRTEAAALWPLLEEVIIATGGVLLRNGIVILDVPGTFLLPSNVGDHSNHLRLWRHKPDSSCSRTRCSKESGP